MGTSEVYYYEGRGRYLVIHRSGFRSIRAANGRSNVNKMQIEKERGGTRVMERAAQDRSFS